MKQKFILVAILFSLSFAKANAQVKGDPWIFQVYQELYSRQPTAWEVNIKNYNSGSWNNYGELKGYIQQYQNSIKNMGISISTTNLKSGNVLALFNQNGKSIAADLITNDGGSIVASGGGNIVASGGGNIVASGGGNIVASGGGNISSLLGVSFGSGRTLQSTGTKVVPTSGSGALIIR